MKFVKIEGGKKLASFIEPMTAKLSDRGPFSDKDWIFEIKWDGYRAVSEVRKSSIKLYSRNGLTFDKAYAKVFNALAQLKIDAVLDGEIVVFDESGKPSFQKLQNYKNSSKHPIMYYVFDCIEHKGKSLTHLPLLERKAILEKILPDSEVIKYCDHHEEDGRGFFKAILKMNLEGMIAKRKDSTYHPGKRSPDWLKVKNIKGQEAIIIGFTKPKNSRKYFGSLLLAVNEKGKLKHIGNVGTGFSDKSLKDLHGLLSSRIQKASSLSVAIKDVADVTWVKSDLICNITFTEITAEGSVRHPVFEGLRVDKEPNEVVLEKQKKKLPKRL